jgi:hypothetical protein
VSFCHSRAAGELIRLSEHLSLRFGSPVDLPVVAIHAVRGADANKHTRKAGHFHAAGELIRLSSRLSSRFGSPVVPPVMP